MLQFFPDALTACHYIVQVKDKIFTVLYKVNKTDYKTYICLTFLSLVTCMPYFSLFFFFLLQALNSPTTEIQEAAKECMKKVPSSHSWLCDVLSINLRELVKYFCLLTSLSS